MMTILREMFDEQSRAAKANTVRSLLSTKIAEGTPVREVRQYQTFDAFMERSMCFYQTFDAFIRRSVETLEPLDNSASNVRCRTSNVRYIQKSISS
jgi:hypothetical protein